MQKNEIASNYKAMHCKVCKSNFLTITVCPMHNSIAEKKKVQREITEIINYFYFHSEEVKKKYS